MMSNSEHMDQYSIAQKLNFTTPQKDRSFEWKLIANGDTINRNLFDSHKKSLISEQIRLVLPLIIVDVPENRNSSVLINKIEKILNES